MHGFLCWSRELVEFSSLMAFIHVLPLGMAIVGTLDFPWPGNDQSAYLLNDLAVVRFANWLRVTFRSLINDQVIRKKGPSVISQNKRDWTIKRGTRTEIDGTAHNWRGTGSTSVPLISVDSWLVPSISVRVPPILVREWCLSVIPVPFILRFHTVTSKLLNPYTLLSPKRPCFRDMNSSCKFLVSNSS